MKSFLELRENVKTADRKPEIYTKPDGKKGTRMVPVDKEVIKQEKTLEWLKSALAREAKKVKPRQDDMEEAHEAKDDDDEEDKRPHTHALVDKKGRAHGFAPYKMYDGHHHIVTNRAGMRVATSDDHAFAKKMAKNRGGSVITTKSVKLKKPMDPKASEKMYGKSIKGHYHEAIDMSKVGTKATIMHPVTRVSKKVDKKDVQKHVDSGWLHMAAKKNRITKSRKEATIPDGQTAMTKTPAMKDKDKKTLGKIADLMKRANEDVSEISKGMASRYIKKSQVSTADAAKSVERGNIDSKSPDRDIAKAGKAQAKKGIKTFINRNKGTSTAVDKLTGKAKVPAKEGMAQGIVKQKISREKEMDARRHDRMMDRARMKDTKKKNMSELSMSMKDLTKTGLNKAASPDKDKIRKGLDALKKAGNAKADAEAGERRKKMSEISNFKMGQYVRKATDDAAKKGAAGDTKKAQARVKGVNKAMDKIDHNRLFGRSGTTYGRK